MVDRPNTLTNRGIGALQLLVGDVDLDTRFGGELGDLNSLEECSHSSSVLRAHQPIGLGKQVSGSHHVVQMQGLGEGRTQKGEDISPRLGSLGLPPTDPRRPQGGDLHC